MSEKIEARTARDMCVSCDFFNINSQRRGGCRNPRLFFGWTQAEEIVEAREEMAQADGCRLSTHLGITGTMAYEGSKWKFVPDAASR